MVYHLLRLALAALLSTSALGAAISAEELAEGKAHGFELHDIIHENGTKAQKWVPSKAILDEQAARMETYYILDPVTNKTILNPAHGERPASLTKRNWFNPYDGAECRMSFMHQHHVSQCCGGGHCEDCSFETSEFRIRDHTNTDTNFAVFDVSPGNWEYYQLDGHRGWWGIASWNWDQWYAIESAFGHIEGQTVDRNMKSDSWCWYGQGSAWWGFWGEASCTDWCSSFNW